ncbi:MAG TPA: POTRA domain-containing protein [Pyrinomonadaceae bacterium]|jgi:outer membrane protein insertion porin family|nr:POTRA domain-containing protein [Pyrinomonadaceae bacterium]
MLGPQASPAARVPSRISIGTGAAEDNSARTTINARIEDYEGRQIVSVELTFENSPPDQSAQGEFLSLLKVGSGTEFSAVRVRDSLQALFDTGRIANARVEATEEGQSKTGPIRLRFVVQRQVQIGDVRIELGTFTGTPVSADEIRSRLNFVQPGTRLSKQLIERNADEIQVYLRDRGYYNATVEPVEQIDNSGVRATVVYKVTPGVQAKVSTFAINITGYDATAVRTALSLQPSAPFTREALSSDVARVRDSLINQGFLSPVLEDPKVERDAEKNEISILLKGAKGPKVSVVVKNFVISDKTQRDLLPVKREGNVDYSAIVEGARRLRNKLQEQGYFFADVTNTCTVVNPPPELGANGTDETCQNLNPVTLTDHTIEIDYEVTQGRRFHLTDIRITGTNKLSFADVEADLKTQKANALGLIPFLGYGRGYTSLSLLEQDKRTVRAFMRDLGYRRADVEVLQGVSVNGDNLIITFQVTEGPLTRIAGVEVRGNKIYTDDRIRQELRTVIGAPYSRSQARADADRVSALYARAGYVDARMEFSIVELPKKGDDEQVRLVYTVPDEGDKVFINQIIINGVTGTSRSRQQRKRNAILRAIPLAPGDVLRADRISDAERELYLTDAYRQVVIHTEPAGETASGYKRRDVIIDVEEKKPNVMDYGGGASTDVGALGLFEISNVNLFDRLRQGAMRLRASRRQQLVRFEYLDPRFARYNKTQFAPLAVSVEYQRDSTITRFFRSAIDRGTMGIVQRLDEEGNPIDIFGNQVNEPTINRFTAAVETQRVLDQKSRTIVFARYSYEDVRLFNLESLVVAPILEPDQKVRLSKLGASLVRDTRERCERGLLNLRRSAYGDEEPGEPGEVCRYNQVDATRGDFLSIDYAIALRQLGGNISFNRFQLTYRRYYKMSALRNTVFAGNLTLGLANLFNPQDRDGNGVIDEIDKTLPISERFFSGGATTLRGFNFEEAGPREVVIPEGPFRDSNKNIVFLNPFTVPVGGNALAIVNLEARVPLTRSFQTVPFYDGGNVFRRAGDLFGKSDPTPVTPGDPLAPLNAANLKAHWTHTVGLGFRFQTPLGGALAIDYGWLLNPPEFLIPQRGPSGGFDGTPAVFRLNRGHLHFRITQTF